MLCFLNKKKKEKEKPLNLNFKFLYKPHGQSFFAHGQNFLNDMIMNGVKENIPRL